MQLSIREITDRISRHISLFGLVLTVIVLAWTYYSVSDLWQGINHDLCKDDNKIRHCSSWNDLANSLTYILIGICLFFIVLSPLNYHPKKNILKSIVLFPIFLTFAIITMFGTWHAGYVNGVHFGWWFVMTLVDAALIIIGLILMWHRKHSTQQGLKRNGG